MRCLACDRALSDYESTRKYPSGAFLDLCNKCFYSGVHQQLGIIDDRQDLCDDVEDVEGLPPSLENTLVEYDYIYEDR